MRRGPPFALAEALEALAPDLPIIPAADTRRLIDRAAALPPNWEFGCLELRPHAPDHVDLLAQINRAAAVDPARWPAGRPEPVKRWIDHANLEAVPVVWLEWDDADTSREPFAWWAAEPDGFRTAAPVPDAAWIRTLSGALGASDASSRTLEGLTRALPAGGRLRALAPLSARGRSAVRTYLELPRGAVGAWLEATKWPGDRNRVIQQWGSAIPLFEPGFIQLEVDDCVTDYLAIEARELIPPYSELRRRRSWMSALAAQGLLRSDDADALCAWVRTPDPRWERRFHLKLRVSPAPIELKIYLSFQRAA